MNEFKTYHPIVNFTYFALVIGFSMFIMHPVFLLISLICAIGYSFLLKGGRELLKNIMLVIPMMLCAAIINPAFNHEGETILCYLPTGNPLTAESFFYGAAAASMIACVMFHFSCYNEVMTSDKFIYLFGKLIPVLSLVFSMVLRFVPSFLARLREITAAQRSIGRDVSKGSIIKRLKCAMKIFSILLTWSIENAVETADSMKSRGYGLPGRTAFSIFHFDKRDTKTLLWLMICSLIVIGGKMGGVLHYRYFPSMIFDCFSQWAVIVEIAYLFLCATPIIIELREEYRWKAIK